MKYNKENLKNIYNYDPKLIDEINKNLELYRNHEGLEYTYMAVIKIVDKNFKYFKKDHRFVYYLTDKVYDNFSLIQIQNYIYASEQVYRDNDYSSLLDFVKHKDEYLAKCYDEMKRNNEELQITSEEELIEKLFKLEYKECNKEFFNNLAVYEMEK